MTRKPEVGSGRGSAVLVDVVVVSYNSGAVLRRAVAGLAADKELHVVVVDNASDEDALGTIADLDVSCLALPTNEGFASGCNHGWRSGSAPYVLFLNPDAAIDPAAIKQLVHVLEADEAIGIAAPQIRDADGALDFSLRRFPRLRSTYAQALFLQRLFPRASWADEVIRDPGAYAERQAPEWVSGACLLVRRRLLEELGGWDEGFFLYCEDIDLCRRTRAAGFEVAFDPSAVAVHSGGHAGARGSLLPTLTRSRIRYASKHRGRLAAALEQMGIALGAFTHMLLSQRGAGVRAGYRRSLAVAARRAGSPS